METLTQQTKVTFQVTKELKTLFKVLKTKQSKTILATVKIDKSGLHLFDSNFNQYHYKIDFNQQIEPVVVSFELINNLVESSNYLSIYISKKITIKGDFSSGSESDLGLNQFVAPFDSDKKLNPFESIGDNFSIPFESEKIFNLLPFCGKDELRPMMLGVNFLCEPDQNLDLAATNGSTLKVTKSAVKNHTSDQIDFILPFHALLIAERLKVKFWDININEAKKSFWLYSDCIDIKGYLIDECFPRYKNIIPTESKFNTSIDSSELLSAISVFKANLNKYTNQIKMRFENRACSLSFENIDMNTSGKVNILCQTNFNESFEIGFNAKLLALVLNGYSKKVMLNFEFNAPNKAVVISEPGRKENSFCLLMPVILDKNY